MMLIQLGGLKDAYYVVQEAKSAEFSPDSDQYRY